MKIKPALILLLAFGLRLVNLNARPLWYDEAFAILYAEKSPAAILAGTLGQVQGAAADVHPVAYYFTLHGWMLLTGESPLSARMLSVLYGMATVALVYYLACTLFSRRVGEWSAFVAAAAPFLIAYSQEARMYAMLGFWGLAAMAAFARAWQSDLFKAWLAFAVCGALTFYSHNLGLFSLTGLAVWVVVYTLRTPAGRERSQRLFKMSMAGVGMALLYTPWLVNVPAQIGKVGQSYWVQRPGVVAIVQTLIAFAFDFENAVIPRWLLPLVLFGAIAILALIAWRLIASRRPGTGRLNQFFLLAAAGVPVALLFAVSQWRPVYIIRGLIPAAIIYIALLGWAMAEMPRAGRLMFGVPLLALTGLVLITFYGYTGFPRGPYAALDAFLRAQAQPGDAIVHSNKLSFFPAYVYDRSLPQSFLADPPGSGSDTLARPTQEALGLFAADLETATSTRSRVWFIVFKQALQETPGGHPHLTWLKSRFDQAGEWSFGDMTVLLFSRKGV